MPSRRRGSPPEPPRTVFFLDRGLGPRERPHQHRRRRLVPLAAVHHLLLPPCVDEASSAYLDELEWRFNNRNNSYLFRDTRFKLCQSEVLSYQELIAS